METWKPILEFPGYSVSNLGHVRNDETGRIMALTVNQQGILVVGLTRENRQYKRSVALLVAREFLDPPLPGPFDTPIHLDGDKSNVAFDNLMWRPRWFAIRYHQQFADPTPGIIVPIEDMKTKEYYRNSWDAATRLGLLDHDIKLAVYNNGYVWPTYQKFRVIGE